AYVDHAPSVVVGDVELMGRRVRLAELGGRSIAEREGASALVADRCRARRDADRAGHGRAAAEVIDAERIALARRHALEADDDPPLLARIERKDASAHEAVAHPLDERRIALGADDRLVDTARLVGVHRLAGDEAAVDRQFEILKGRA